jgi:hypothetical protein
MRHDAKIKAMIKIASLERESKENANLIIKGSKELNDDQLFSIQGSTDREILVWRYILKLINDDNKN